MSDATAKRGYLVGAVTVLVGAIFFSTKAIFVKLAYQHEIDSVSLLTLRMAFSFPFFIVIGYWASRKKSNQVRPINTKDLRWTILMGLLGYYIASLLDFLGLQYISASFERIILYLYPTLVLIISSTFFKAKIRKIHILALLLTYVGVGIAFFENLKMDQGEHLVKGTILIFSAALAYAIYLVGSGHLLPKIGTYRYNSISMSAACLGVFTHNIYQNGLDLFDYSTSVYQIAIAMAFIATVIPSFMIAEGIRVIGSSNASIIGSIGPITTIILAYIFLNERLGSLQVIGTLFVIVGVLLITLQKRKDPM